MPRKPNLLFIFTDQQRADTLACYGNHFVQAPNLNRLAAESTVFENAYVTQPVCTPSRASLLTGLYPHTTGCLKNHEPLRAEFPTLAELVAPDYVRVYMGKWHLGNEIIPQRGFETFVSIEDRYREYYTQPEYLDALSSYHQFLVAQGCEPTVEDHGARIFSMSVVTRLPEPLSRPRFLGREAARFLRVSGDRPFILYVSFFEPHPPWHSALDGFYQPEEVPVGPTFRRSPPASAALLHCLHAASYRAGTEMFGEDMTTETGWRTLRANYLGMITLVDRAVGDILQALDDSGHREDTVVVFTSDHGEMMGDHGQFQKGVLYQESIRVPLLIRVPWLHSQPRRVPAPVSHIDVVPTLLDLLGQPVPGDLAGESWVPLLAGKAASACRDVVVEWNGNEGRRPSKWLKFVGEPPNLPWEQARGPWRTLISADGFKLNLSPTDRGELYNLAGDPYEQANLFGQLEQQGRIRDMAARLRSWQVRTADTIVLPEF